MEEIKRCAAKMLKKGKELYGRKELWKETLLLAAIVLLVTYFPSIYMILPRTGWRILAAGFIFAGTFVLSCLMICRLIKRCSMKKVEKSDWLIFLKRLLVINLVFLAVILFQIAVFYPTFLVKQGGKIFVGKTLLLWAIQSLFFSIYAQAVIAACMRFDQNLKEWMGGFFKHGLKTVPLFTILAFLSTAVSHGIGGISEIVGQMISAFFTVFLWITVIAVQERKL